MSKINFSLKNLLKALGALGLILGIIAIINGVSVIRQFNTERNEMFALNDNLKSQGLTMETKNGILSYVGKHPETKNIVVTDKDDNILYSANTQYVSGLTKFVLEQSGRNYGIMRLKDTQTEFVVDPRSVMPMFDRNRPGGRRGPMMGPGRNDSMHGFMLRGGEYQKRIVRGNDALFLNSFKDNDKLNVYYVGSKLRENMWPQAKGLFITFALLKLVGLIFWTMLAVWVYKDSRKRGFYPLLWGLVTIVTGLFGLIAYLVARSIVKFCHNCNEKVGKDAEFCGNCGAALKHKCENCENILNDDENFCPKCGTKRVKE